MKQIMLTGLMLSIATTFAAAAEWQPVLYSPGPDVNTAANTDGSTKWAKPTEGDGTVNPHAGIAMSKLGSITVAVAVDSLRPDAKSPDVICLDASGKSKFAGKPALPMKRTHIQDNPFFAVIGPESVRIQHNGRTIPVDVRGRCLKSSQPNAAFGHLALGIHTAVQGKCRFGEKTYPIRLLDRTGQPVHFLTADGGRPDPPDFEVVDAAGQKVRSGKFKYG